MAITKFIYKFCILGFSIRTKEDRGDLQGIIMQNFTLIGATVAKMSVIGPLARYYHAKFYTDRCHCRQDVCNWTEKLKKQQI